MKMKVQLTRLNSDMRFESRNDKGQSTLIDGGTSPEGMRPMELLLTALASCSAFDLEHILRKQKQEVTDVQIAVEGLRPDEGVPKPFEAIHMHFKLTGKLEKAKVARAVALSVDKYCSVRSTFRPETKVTYTVEIVKTS